MSLFRTLNTRSQWLVFIYYLLKEQLIDMIRARIKIIHKVMIGFQVNFLIFIRVYCLFGKEIFLKYGVLVCETAAVEVFDRFLFISFLDIVLLLQTY